MPVLGSYHWCPLRSPSQLVSWAKDTPKATGRRICPSSNPRIAFSPPGLYLTLIMCGNFCDHFCGKFRANICGKFRRYPSRKDLKHVLIADFCYITDVTCQLCYRGAVKWEQFCKINYKHLHFKFFTRKKSKRHYGESYPGRRGCSTDWYPLHHSADDKICLNSIT